jgi:hypothetical protein
MEINKKPDEKKTTKVVNKTTETLIKELDATSDIGLHDMFMFVYRLACNQSNLIYREKFIEFLESFTSNPFNHKENKSFRKEFIENLIKYSYDHMSLLTAAILIKKKFTMAEIIENYYSNIDVFSGSWY